MSSREISALNISDIDEMEQIITNRRKQSIVGLDPLTIQILKKYLNEERGDPKISDDNDALFLSNRACRLSPRAVLFILQKYLKKLKNN